MSSTDSAGALLTLLGDIYLSGRSGRLRLDREGEQLGLSFERGRLVRAETLGHAPPPLPHPNPGDELGHQLARILTELRIERRSAGNSGPRPCGRGPLLEALVGNGGTFDFGESDVAAEEHGDPGLSTEELVLEAVRRMPDLTAVRAALGNVDRPVALALNPDFNRELTPTDAYILSRVDGKLSAAEVLNLVPKEPDETERSLLGLLLTGVVELLEAPPPKAAPLAPDAAPRAAPVAPDAAPLTSPAPGIWATTQGPAVAATPPGVDARHLARLEPRRREVVNMFEALAQLSHFEMLGVSESASEQEIKQAFFLRAKKFHPDQYRDPGFADLADKIEAIFMRVGGAYEVLRDAQSRSSYEAALRRRRAAQNPGAQNPGWGSAPAAPPPPSSPTASVEAPHPDENQIIDTAENAWMAEEALHRADGLITAGKVWDAIQLLTAVIPRIYGRRQKDRARIFLAKAYIKNPNWLRRGEELLQLVIQEDPQNAEAHFALGMLYKDTGMSSRAVTLFKKALELRPEHKQAQAELSSLSGGAAFLRKIFGKG
jgi:curved DNA-binding protein CbpA